MGTLDMPHVINFNEEKGQALPNQGGVSTNGICCIKATNQNVEFLPNVLIGYLLMRPGRSDHLKERDSNFITQPHRVCCQAVPSPFKV